MTAEQTLFWIKGILDAQETSQGDIDLIKDKVNEILTRPVPNIGDRHPFIKESQPGAIYNGPGNLKLK